MEYAEIIAAVREGDRAKVNAILKDIQPHLIRFLKIHYNALTEDAEDAVQNGIVRTLKSIKKDTIKNPDQILSYIMTACKNEYLNLVNKKAHNHDEYTDRFGDKPRQLVDMIDEERRNALQWCIEQLSDSYQSFIEYWFEFPESSAQAAARKFDISINNAWTRKHRIIKKLNECVERINR